jgi:hypothetical protein
MVSLYICSYWLARACASVYSYLFRFSSSSRIAASLLVLSNSCCSRICCNSLSFYCFSSSTNLLYFRVCSSCALLYLSLRSCSLRISSSSIRFFSSSILYCSSLTLSSSSSCLLSIISSCLCLSISSLIFSSSRTLAFSSRDNLSACCSRKTFFLLSSYLRSFLSSSSSKSSSI